ncbi:hypothetical protein [Kocuria oceani]|uniref:Uncharacterized protein n=1 Tax=Kocuria oceani TaxID=988827 RepID=A0ABV9TPS4_9MICC|nr:hypothetical protein [Kocuria oceani]
MLKSETGHAKRAIARLGLEVQRHYANETGALSYFAGQLNVEQRVYVTDYLIDVMGTLDSSLGDMDTCLSQYKQKRETEEFQRKSRIDPSSSQIYVSGPNKNEEDARFYREMLEEQFFFKFGGVIDLLASVVVMVSGVGLDVRKCSYHELKPKGRMEEQASKPANRLGLSLDEEVRESQLSVLRSLHSAIVADGEADWFSWVLDRRNQMVHRAQGVGFILIRQGKVKGQVDFVDLPPKYPQEGMISAYKKARGVKGSFIPEDIQDVMHECHARLCHILIAVIDACVSICAQRGSRDLNIDQQAAQWPLEDRADYNFNGFNPNQSIVKGIEKADTAVGTGSLIDRVQGASAIFTNE